MKTALLFHKFGGNPDIVWYPWLKKELELKGIDLIIPQLPNPSEPRLADWLKVALDTYRRYQPEIVIGHSLGGSLVFKLLEEVGQEGTIKKAIVVAPPVHDERAEKLHRTEFFAKPIDWEKLKSFPVSYIVFYSQDDQAVSSDHAQVVRDKLEAAYKLFFNRGHFDQNEFPELVREIGESAN